MTPVLICTRQRSGSHAFASVLSRNGMRVFEEVFTPKCEEDWAFYPWLEEEGKTPARKLLLEPEAVFAEFLAFLTDKAKGQRVGLDVKQNHLHLFNGQGMMPEDCPGLLKIFHKARWPVIHLYRRNVFHQAASREIAKQTRVYHVEVGQPPPEFEPIALDINRCIQFMERTEQAISWLRKWNAHYPFFHEYVFEDLFKWDALEKSEAARITKEIGLTITDYEGAYRNAGYNLRRCIRNRDDVLSGLKETRYHELAAEAIG